MFLFKQNVEEPKLFNIPFTFQTDLRGFRYAISRIRKNIRLAKLAALVLVWARLPEVGVTPGAWKPPLPAAPFAVSAGGSGT